MLPLVLGVGSPGIGAAPAHHTARVARVGVGWAWPVVGPVIRDFDPPEDPYSAGHRGIDIGVPFGTPITAPEAGVVTFSGKVGGQLFVTLDHGGGLSSTYSWLSATSVRKGDSVPRGGQIGSTGVGHPGSTVTHLHFGVRLNGTYLDPMDYLGPLDVPSLLHLAPALVEA